MIRLINWVFIYQISDTLYSIVRYKAGLGCKYCVVNLWHLVIGLPSPLRAFFVESKYGTDELACTARSLSLTGWSKRREWHVYNTHYIYSVCGFGANHLVRLYYLLFWHEPWSPRWCSVVGDDRYISLSRYSHY